MDAGDVKIHFNIHFDPAKGDVTNKDISETIVKEIEVANITGSVLHPLEFDIG